MKVGSITSIVLSIILSLPATAAAAELCLGQRPTIVGTAANDRLHGTSGRDVIVGKDGDDLIWGDGGADLICGNRGDDVVRGGGGKDEIDGGLGWNTLYGNGGNDHLTGATRRGFRDEFGSALWGGAGDDVIDAGGAGATAHFESSTGPVTVDMAAGTVRGQGNDTLVNIGMVIGSLHDDTMTTDGSAVLVGSDGDDVLIGSPSTDSLYGGDGSDQLTGDSGDDELTGGAGSDQIDGGAGEDLLDGEAGADTVDGGDDADIVSGGFGDDTLSGGGGDDDLYDGFGNDSSDGGEGDDTLQNVVGSRGPSTRTDDDLYAGGPGRDLLALTAGKAMSLTVDLAAGTVRGVGSDRLSGIEDARGGWGDDMLIGDDSANHLDGYFGNDIVRGEVGDDTIQGGSGSDQLFGGEGTDVGYWEATDVCVAHGMVIDLAAGTTTAPPSMADNPYCAFTDEMSELENITSPAQTEDTILGDDGPNVIYGDGHLSEADAGPLHAAADHIDGRGGDDSLHGEGGDDTIEGGTGTDTIDGGSGTDTCTGGEVVIACE